MNETIVLAPLWVPLVSVFIPLLVAAATKTDSNNIRRAVLAIVAAGVLAVVEQVIGDGATVSALIASFMTASVAQLVAYKSLWAPLFDVNAKVLPTKGII